MEIKTTNLGRRGRVVGLLPYYHIFPTDFSMPRIAPVWALIISVVLCCTVAVRAEERTLGAAPGKSSIQAAIDSAHDGDTVLVEPGVYVEKLVVRGKRITLASRFLSTNRAADIEQTVLDGGPEGKRKGKPILTIEEGAAAKIVGFTIRNSHHAVVNAGHIETLNNRFVENGDALSFESGRGLVRSNVFEHNGDDGIDLDDSSAVTIEDNIIRDNKDDGIEIRLHKYRGPTLEIVIRRNMFAHNREDGLQLIDYPGASDRTFRIERNVFVGNSMAAIGSMENGNMKENYAGADMLEPVVVLNNTFVDNPYAITGGDNFVLLNNVIVGSKVALKRLHGDSAAGVNLLWKNAADQEDCDVNSSKFVEADPRLDPEFRPRKGSPCIDAGATKLSYNGVELAVPTGSYQGAAPDLGAMEFGGKRP